MEPSRNSGRILKGVTVLAEPLHVENKLDVPICVCVELDISDLTVQPGETAEIQFYVKKLTITPIHVE